MPVTRPIIFLGPTLAKDAASTLIDAEVRAPVAGGDVMRALDARPPAIGIIDGVFKDRPTVRHREILWALAEGVPVFGAASMGALRAAELWRDGMIGVGLIYRWYRRFPLLPDDAVAVTHAPEALGHRALSDALVDIRQSLKAARRAGALATSEAREMAEAARTQPFPERRLAPQAARFRVDQKAEDARALLTRMAEHGREGTWPVPDRDRPPVAHAWLDDLADSGIPFR